MSLFSKQSPTSTDMTDVVDINKFADDTPIRNIGYFLVIVMFGFFWRMVVISSPWQCRVSAWQCHG